jgi:uncharacterized protein YcfL
MKKLIVAIFAAFMLISCAPPDTVAVPKNLVVIEEPVSVFPKVLAKLKASTYPNMSVIAAYQADMKPLYTIRLEIYDFDGNGVCDENGVDGGMAIIKDPTTDMKWQTYRTFSCADSLIIRDNIVTQQNTNSF